MARVYHRDSNGRFASGGGGGGGGKSGGSKGKAKAKPKAKKQPAKYEKYSKMMADVAGGRSSTKKANAAKIRQELTKGTRAVGDKLRKSMASKFSGAGKTKASVVNHVFSNGERNYSTAKPKGTVSRKR